MPLIQEASSVLYVTWKPSLSATNRSLWVAEGWWKHVSIWWAGNDTGLVPDSSSATQAIFFSFISLRQSSVIWLLQRQQKDLIWQGKTSGKLGQHLLKMETDCSSWKVETMNFLQETLKLTLRSYQNIEQSVWINKQSEYWTICYTFSKMLHVVGLWKLLSHSAHSRSIPDLT